MTVLPSWVVGDVRITKLVETVVPTPVLSLLPTADPERAASHDHWLRPHFVDGDGNLLLSVHALVVETADRRIVVDTCIGNGKPSPFPGWSDLSTDFLDTMTGAGFHPDSIDTVVCTHLHFDHVGWNTRLVDGRWVPTFAHARHLLGRREYDYWTDGAHQDLVSLDQSVRPLFDAGLVDLVGPGHPVAPGVWLDATPGHTPGHHSVRIASGGSEAVITGDVAHHPLQFAEVEWRGAGDSDPAAATRTRKAFARRWAGSRGLVIGTHFAGPTAGYLVAEGDGWRFVVES